MKNALLKILGVVGGLSASSIAMAIPVTHLGGLFDVTGSLVDNNTADFTYTADFTNWTGASDYIFAIDFKVEGLEVSTIDSFSTSATGDWTIGNGPTSANGCANNSNFTFACAQDDPFDSTTGQETAGIVTWDFQVTFTSDVTEADLFNYNNHIGAFFYDCGISKNTGEEVCKGKEGLSLNTSFNVPEPSVIALFGLGLVGLGVAGRRRSIKS